MTLKFINENEFCTTNIQSINSRVKLGEKNFSCDPICYRPDNSCIVHVYLKFNARLTDDKSCTAIVYTFTLMPRLVEMLVEAAHFYIVIIRPRTIYVCFQGWIQTFHQILLFLYLPCD